MLNKLIATTIILLTATGFNVVLAKTQRITPTPQPTAAHVSPVAKAKGNPLLSGKVYGGKVTFYDDYYHGRRTANGETFDQRKLTAASATLPFGTVLYVSNANNTKYVLVRINDRMPASDVVLDLSKAAFKQLGKLHDGVLNVHVVEVALEPKRVR